MTVVNLRRSPLYTRFVRPLVWPPIRAYRRLQDASLDRALARSEASERPLLEAARAQYAASYAAEETPLVTVAIPTYNRADLLLNRTLPSSFNQTYANLEVLVIGDHCADDTPQRLREVPDPRLRFYDLPERPQYPTEPKRRWRVAGAAAMNKGLKMARGSWIVYQDDDDVFLSDHVESLLRFALAGDYEFVFGRTRYESVTGVWGERGRGPSLPSGRAPFRESTAYISHSTILYRSYLRLFEYDLEAWKLGRGADAHRWLRMGRAGVRAGFLDQVVTLQPLRPHETVRTLWQPE